ncbi:MAG: non-canonical purine NTP pyrophosphatase, partial [Fimbriimonadaceae bacterium]
MNERTARFLCCVALQAPGMEQTILHATCEGRVVLEPRGGGGGGGGAAPAPASATPRAGAPGPNTPQRISPKT